MKGLLLSCLVITINGIRPQILPDPLSGISYIGNYFPENLTEDQLYYGYVSQFHGLPLDIDLWLRSTIALHRSFWGEPWLKLEELDHIVDIQSINETSYWGVMIDFNTSIRCNLKNENALFFMASSILPSLADSDLRISFTDPDGYYKEEQVTIYVREFYNLIHERIYGTVSPSENGTFGDAFCDVYDLNEIMSMSTSIFSTQTNLIKSDDYENVIYTWGTSSYKIRTTNGRTTTGFLVVFDNTTVPTGIKRPSNLHLRLNSTAAITGKNKFSKGPRDVAGLCPALRHACDCQHTGCHKCEPAHSNSSDIYDFRCISPYLECS